MTSACKSGPKTSNLSLAGSLRMGLNEMFQISSSSSSVSGKRDILFNADCNILSLVDNIKLRCDYETQGIYLNISIMKLSV